LKSLPGVASWGMPNRSSKPKLDVNQPANSSVEQITGDALKQDAPEKNAAAVALGRLGGLKGGKARAEKLTPEKRSEIAREAAQKRWGKNSD
jgi:hypothetical protein